MVFLRTSSPNCKEHQLQIGHIRAVLKVITNQMRVKNPCSILFSGLGAHLTFCSDLRSLTSLITKTPSTPQLNSFHWCRCGGVNKNDPHLFICLNTWSPFDGTIWEEIEFVAYWIRCVAVFEISKDPHISQYVLFLLLDFN